MAQLRFRIDAATVAILLTLACGADARDDDPTGGGPGPGDDGGTDATGSGGDDGDDGATTGGATSDDGATGGDGSSGDGATDGVPPDGCPASGKPAPTGCWSMGADWDDVRCGCGPSMAQTGGPSGSAEDISSCSHFPDVGGLFSEINRIRDQYVDSPPTLCHSRYKGIPWEGENAGMTWPSLFTWDDCLAAQAQALAEEIAAGTASHQGTLVDGQNGCCADFYMDNMNADDFRITFDENMGDFDGGRFAISQGNGSARMGLYYHDFAGDGPVIQQLGIGASVGANCRVTWVLQFGT